MTSCPAPRVLIDVDAAAQILCADAGIRWPGHTRPRDIQIERAWPIHSGGFLAEWSFALHTTHRYTLWSVTGSSEMDTGPNRFRPVVTGRGIRGVFVRAPAWGVQVYSPDCDPRLPHLACCLDGREMTRHLGPLLKSQGAVPGLEVDCRLLSYRPGRRATIGLVPPQSDRRATGLIGKTYRDDRGKKLMRTHQVLADALAERNTAMRVPAVAGFLPDLKLALFERCPDPAGPVTCGGLQERALLAADSLATLHSVDLPTLRGFTSADEHKIIRRWQTALAVADQALSEQTNGLIESLLTSPLPPESECTIHRDFYDRQFIVGNGAVTLLDLDTLARGDSSVDMANFLVHLYLATIILGWTPSDYETLSRLVLRQYLDRGGCLNRRLLTFYLASSAFRVGAVHALRTRTRTYAPRLWSFAGSFLGHMGIQVRQSGTNPPDPRFILEVLRS